VTDPERLVIDFPDAVPGPQLRSVPGNHGDVKGVRTGLFSANPPITRVVLELQSTQDFRLVPSNKSVIVRLGGSNAATLHLPPVRNLRRQARPHRRSHRYRLLPLRHWLQPECLLRRDRPLLLPFRCRPPLLRARVQGQHPRFLTYPHRAMARRRSCAMSHC
jgi:hypothetical protein